MHQNNNINKVKLNLFIESKNKRYEYTLLANIKK